jgi:hypothetical protein
LRLFRNPVSFLLLVRLVLHLELLSLVCSFLSTFQTTVALRYSSLPLETSKESISRILGVSIILKHIGQLKRFNNIEHIEILKDWKILEDWSHSIILIPFNNIGLFNTIEKDWKVIGIYHKS